MTAHVLIILLFAGWMVLNVFALLLLRRMPKPAAMVFGTFVAVVSFGSFLVGLYVFGEFVINKGPDDWGSMWHASYPLAAKFGSANDSSYELAGFDKDSDGSGSGTYRVRYIYDQHRGIVLCHYNKATHKFDHDDIQENQ